MRAAVGHSTIVATNMLLLRSIAPLYIFMVAAAMDDIESSILAFENRYLPSFDNNCAKSRGIHGIHNHILLGAVLSLTPRGGEDAAWPFGLWTRFPAEYRRAASRTWSKGCSKVYHYDDQSERTSVAFDKYGSADFGDTVDSGYVVDVVREYVVSLSGP